MNKHHLYSQRRLIDMFREFILVILSCISVLCFEIPDSITPCQRQDSECLTKLASFLYDSAINGDAALGAESSDPMHQDLIDGKLPTVNYSLFNTTITGYKKCKITSAKHAPGSPHLLLNMYCPELHMIGEYEIDGHLVVLPIQGKGPYTVDFKDYYITVDAEIKVSPGKDNNRYWSIKQFTVEADLRGGMDLDLQNLFNGQKDLAEPVSRFIRESWREVAHLLQGPAFSANLKKIVKNFNKYARSVPVERLIKQ